MNVSYPVQCNLFSHEAWLFGRLPLLGVHFIVIAIYMSERRDVKKKITPPTKSELIPMIQRKNYVLTTEPVLFMLSNNSRQFSSDVSRHLLLVTIRSKHHAYLHRMTK
jgi:hypothetical protein